jgi:hypothetical protein
MISGGYLTHILHRLTPRHHHQLLHMSNPGNPTPLLNLTPSTNNNNINNTKNANTSNTSTSASVHINPHYHAPLLSKLLSK